MAVPDGGTVVLGGLKTLAEGRSEFGPPVLSQIPYINRLFKNVGIGRETRHVMLMVTPRIIINSEEEIFQTEGRPPLRACLLLQDLGFGLDLSECAVTGTDADLIYVSPKSGRAVSRDAGKPYCDRLLKLPRFLLEEDASATPADVLAGLALTGHFLERDFLTPHGLALPLARERLIGLLARGEAATA